MNGKAKAEMEDVEFAFNNKGTFTDFREAFPSFVESFRAQSLQAFEWGLGALKPTFLRSGSIDQEIETSSRGANKMSSVNELIWQPTIADISTTPSPCELNYAKTDQLALKPFLSDKKRMGSKSL